MRLAKLALATLVALLAVWFEAVLRTPAVKRRKALRRSGRRARNS
jgi:hypothetical protein